VDPLPVLYAPRPSDIFTCFVTAETGLWVERIFITVRSAIIKKKSLRDHPASGSGLILGGTEAGSFSMHVDIVAHIL
jgi:hypothetical protein